MGKEEGFAVRLLCIFMLCAGLLMSVSVASGKDKTEILVGTHLPLSGSLAMAAVEQKWAYEQAVKDINKKGGVFVKEYGKKLPVRLVVMDDQTDPGKAASAVEQMVKRTKVDLLLSGHTGAHGVVPGLIAANKYRKYYHATLMWFPNYLEHNFKWSTLYSQEIEQLSSVPYDIWKALPKNQQPTKIALFLEDNFDGKMMGDGLVEVNKKYGYNIVMREYMADGQKDFSAQIIKAQNAGIDAILLLANTSETITLIRQMKENNFNVKYFYGWKGTWPAEFWDALRGDAEGIMCDGFWSEDYPLPGARELGERYRADFKKGSLSIGVFYALCQSLFQAVEKAGTLDSAKIRQAVVGNEFDTVMGKVRYNDKGCAVFLNGGFQWRNGRQIVIYPFQYAKEKVKPIAAWTQR